MSQISSYQSNNRGAVPLNANVNAFVTSYLTNNGDTFADPQKDNYPINVGAGTPATGNIQYSINARCGANGAVTVNGAAATNNRQVAASVGLEAGGAYCQQS